MDVERDNTYQCLRESPKAYAAAVDRARDHVAAHAGNRHAFWIIFALDYDINKEQIRFEGHVVQIAEFGEKIFDVLKMETPGDILCFAAKACACGIACNTHSLSGLLKKTCCLEYHDRVNLVVVSGKMQVAFTMPRIPCIFIIVEEHVPRAQKKTKCLPTVTVISPPTVLMYNSKREVLLSIYRSRLSPEIL